MLITGVAYHSLDALAPLVIFQDFSLYIHLVHTHFSIVSTEGAMVLIYAGLQTCLLVHLHYMVDDGIGSLQRKDWDVCNFFLTYRQLQRH